MSSKARTLAQLARGIAKGGIRVVDLTQLLQPSTPIIPLPPEFGAAWPFSMEEISRYDSRGPLWYWNNIKTSEHTGTHFDAPIHWVTGKDIPNSSVDTIPVKKFIAPACVIDCSKKSAKNSDFLLTVAEVKSWERKHGKIGRGSWVFLRTDWSKRRRRPADYLNLRDDGAHTPGPHPDVVPFLIEKRDVIGFGNETVGTDAGQAFKFDPPFPCHSQMHGANRFGLAGITNLDKLPPTGAVVIAAPLKIIKGSGSPCRVLALVPGK